MKPVFDCRLTRRLGGKGGGAVGRIRRIVGWGPGAQARLVRLGTRLVRLGTNITFEGSR